MSGTMSVSITHGKVCTHGYKPHTSPRAAAGFLAWPPRVSNRLSSRHVASREMIVSVRSENVSQHCSTVLIVQPLVSFSSWPCQAFYSFGFFFFVYIIYNNNNQLWSLDQIEFNCCTVSRGYTRSSMSFHIFISIPSLIL